MKRDHQAFWDWPGWAHLSYTAILAAAVALWFGLVYGGADLLTAHHAYRVRLYLDVELGMPFVPEAVLLYMSVYLHYLAAPFVLRTRHEVRALAGTLAVVIFCGGVGFVLCPAETAYPTPPEMGIWDGLVQFAKALALRHNLAPSLHVALAVVCIRVFASCAALPGQVLLWTWAVVIAASTLLLHQHYLIDVLTGFALGWLGVTWIYRRWTNEDS